MREGWKIVRLGDVCTFENGDRGKNYPGRKAFVKEGIPFINAGHLNAAGIDIMNMDFISKARFDLLSNGKVQEGDLLFCLRGSLGKFAVVEDLSEGAIASSLVIVRPGRMLNKYFLAAYFDSRICCDMIQKFKNGTAQPNLSAASLRLFEIPVPPLAEQQRIVAILDEAFDGIAAAIANSKKNLANARELFETTIVSGLFGDHVAQGWQPTTVEDLAAAGKGSIRTGPFGSQLLHGEFVDDGVAVLGIDNAVMNEFRWAKRRFITPNKYAELTRYTVKPGDVLITIMGTCGRCAVVPDDIPVAINTKHLCCITLNREKCLPQFLHAYFLYHPVARAFLASRAKGSIMEGLNMGIIRELPVWVPSLLIQTDVLSKLEILEARIQALQSAYEQKLNALSELKQALLGQALSGQMTAHPEKALREAAE